MKALRTQFDGTGAPRTVATPTCCCSSCCCCCAATLATASALGTGAVIQARESTRLSGGAFAVRIALALLLPWLALIGVVLGFAFEEPAHQLAVLVLAFAVLGAGYWYLVSFRNRIPAMVTAAIMVVLLWAALTSELLISVNLFLRESFSPVLYLVLATGTAVLISLIMLLHWRPGRRSAIEVILGLPRRNTTDTDPPPSSS